MNFEVLFAIALPILGCLYAIKQKKYFFLFSFFSILFLGVTQIEILLAFEVFEVNKLFSFDEESLVAARRVFEVINIFGILFLSFTKIRKPYILVNSKKIIFNLGGLFLVFSIFILAATSLVLSANTFDSGRPVFLGIGIAIGLLMPISTALFLLTDKVLYQMVGLFGVITVLNFSRLFACLALIIIVIYRIKIFQLRDPSVKKLIVISFTVILIFFISGQFKHLIAQGESWQDALNSAVYFHEWIFDFSSPANHKNLGVLSNYIVGVEWGAEVADCIYQNQIDLNNFIGTLNDLYNALFPGFMRHSLDLDLSGLSCNVAVIKSPLVDFIRAFGGLGVVIFAIILWSYISAFEYLIGSAKNNFQIYCACLFGVYSIFIIRGSIGALISFSIASITGVIIINYCLGNLHVKKK